MTIKNPSALLRFPSNFDDEKTMWIKYDIFKVVQGNNSTRTLRPRTSSQSIATIALSLPSDGLSISDKQKWSTDSSNIMDQIGSALGSGGSVLEGVAGGFAKVAGSIIKNASATHSIVDKMALKYEGPEIRSFTTKHKMVPRNLRESQSIQEIIKKFRHSSAPTVRNQGFGLIYDLPEFFKVTYMDENGISEIFPQHNTCYCSSVDVTYSRTTFQDNYPTEVELTLSFTELDPMNKSTVNGGY
jgi:DNA-binding ferritin-like protein (Dps family)